MTAADSWAEATHVVAILSQTHPELVVATWGGTARGEMTTLSDLDLICWNPGKVRLPELKVRHAAYLDLVTCEEDEDGLRTWALANATDLHAVMFARHAGSQGHRTTQFGDVARTLWRDETLRAREIYHLIATSIAVPMTYGETMYRPEKFALGATRCWSALAECGQLASGIRYQGSTEDALGTLASNGLLRQTAAVSFREAMHLRRRCEDGTTSFRSEADAFAALGRDFRACAADLITATLPWLQQHTPLTQSTFDGFYAFLLGHADAAPAPGRIGLPSEAEAMIRCFLARDSSQISEMLAQSPHGESWWVRHAAIMNPHCDAASLAHIVDEAIGKGRMWADRNLILYAIRHPAADQPFLARLKDIEYRLRQMDRDALASRFRAMD